MKLPIFIRVIAFSPVLTAAAAQTNNIGFEALAEQMYAVDKKNSLLTARVDALTESVSHLQIGFLILIFFVVIMAFAILVLIARNQVRARLSALNVQRIDEADDEEPSDKPVI